MTITTVVTSMKDEAPYILEWVAYHRAIGFDRLVILANDCTDGTHEMLERLRDMGEISYFENKVPLGGKPHSLALKIANASEVVKTSDYVMVLDADEFLVIKTAPHKVSTLIAEMEQLGADMMVVPWRMFGSSHQYQFRDAPVVERFREAMDVSGKAKTGVKTLFRQHADLRLAIHFPKPIMHQGATSGTSFKWIDAGGKALNEGALTWNGGRNKITRDHAEVAHYMIKSLDEYMLKIFRGDGLMNSNRHGIDYWRSADRNESRDLVVADHAPGFAAEFARLSADPQLAALHRTAIAKRVARLNEILSNEKAVRLREILHKSTEGTLTEAEVTESRALVLQLSPGKLPTDVMEGDIPKSYLLSITTAGIAQTPGIVDRIGTLCRNNAAMFWHEKDFAKRPITNLIEGLKRAQKSKRTMQLGVRYFDNYAVSDRAAGWPLDGEITVVVTRAPEMLLAGLPGYVAHSKARHLDKKHRGFPALRGVLSGKESIEEVEALISAGMVDDPRDRLARFVRDNPETVVLNLDAPEEALGRITDIAQLGEAGRVAARILRKALFPEAEDTAPDTVVPEASGRSVSRMASSSLAAKDQGAQVRVQPSETRRASGQAPVRMYWFRRNNGSAEGNFGDELGPMLVTHLTGRAVEWAAPEDCDIAGVGSILSQVSRKAAGARRRNDLLIWGSGLIEPDPKPLHDSLKLLAVRGQGTIATLGLPAGMQTGDPGILSEQLVPSARKKYKWGIVPHYTHRTSRVITDAARQKGCVLIDPTAPPTEVLRMISSCHGIISSSLHGLIVADSYGVPCVWLNIQSHKSHEFKFADYCSGVGRKIFEQIAPEGLDAITQTKPEIRARRPRKAVAQKLASVLKDAL